MWGGLLNSLKVICGNELHMTNDRVTCTAENLPCKEACKQVSTVTTEIEAKDMRLGILFIDLLGVGR